MAKEPKEPTSEERLELERLRAERDTISEDDIMYPVEMKLVGDLIRAIASGSNADIAQCLRLVHPKLLDQSILDALADRLGNPRGNRTRAAAALHRDIAREVDWFFRKRLAAGEPKRGLMKAVIGEIAERRGVSPRTVESAIRKHR